MWFLLNVSGYKLLVPLHVNNYKFEYTVAASWNIQCSWWFGRVQVRTLDCATQKVFPFPSHTQSFPLSRPCVPWLRSGSLFSGRWTIGPIWGPKCSEPGLYYLILFCFCLTLTNLPLPTALYTQPSLYSVRMLITVWYSNLLNCFHTTHYECGLTFIVLGTEDMADRIKSNSVNTKEVLQKLCVVVVLSSGIHSSFWFYFFLW